MSAVYYWPCDLASTALSRIKEALTALGNVRWTTRAGGQNFAPSALPGRITCEFKSLHYDNSCTLLLCSSSRSPHSRTLLMRKDATVRLLCLESSIEGILSRMHEGDLAVPRQTAHLDGELGHGTSAGLGTVTFILGTIAIGNAVTGVMLLMAGLREERERWQAQILPPQHFPSLELIYHDNDDKDAPIQGEAFGDRPLAVALSMAVNKVFFS